MDYIDLIGCPRVQRSGFHLGNVSSETSMDARTIDADENAEIDDGPSRIGLTTIGAVSISGSLHDFRQSFRVLLVQFDVFQFVFCRLKM